MALNAVRMKKKVVLILEKVSELERILDGRQGARRAAAPRHARQALRARLGQVGEVGRRGREVRPDDARDARGGQDPEVRGRCSTAWSCSTSTSARRSRTSGRSRRRSGRPGRVYAKLRALGVPIQYLNLGGGLGVDYDGSKTAFDSSMNYSVQEYANDVVYTIKQICDEEKVPAPTLVTESGRAVTAYHSVFVTNVLDVADRIEQGRRVSVTATDPTSSRSSPSIYETVNAKNLRESYHDALQYKEELFTLFNLGHLSLEDRSKGEILFWQICEQHPPRPEDPEGDPGGVRGHGDDARGQVRPQLLRLPVAAGRLGDRPALPDPADPPPARAARRSSARSRTSRATRTERSRSSSTCATSRRRSRSTRSARASRTTSASASWARTRTCSATSTTSSARRTRCS